MNFASFSIRRPVLVTVAALVAILVGVVSLMRLPMDLLPNMNAPIIAIVTPFPGASAQEMSDLVAKPVEDAAATSPGVKDIHSIAQENVATVVVQYDWGANMSEAREELRTRIDQVSLPDGAEKPILTKFDPTAVPILQLDVTNGEDMADLTRTVNDTIVPRLELVDGVANISVLGGLEEQVRVELDQAKLAQYRLTPEQVAALIKASNLNVPLGDVKEDGTRLNLRLVGKAVNLEDLENLELMQVPSGLAETASGPAGLAGPAAPTGSAAASRPSPSPVSIRLKDVASVTLGYADRTSVVRSDGKPSIRLAIQKGSNANTVRVADDVRKALDDLQKENPDLSVATVSDSADIIRSSIYDLARDMVLGGFLAIAVLWLFLRSFRTTSISAVSLPVSVVSAFALLFFAHKGLNLMTLGGLTLAVGLVIDDSIVVIEAIHRHLDRGKAPADAARDGTAEVLTAVVSSTLTTVAVFLPIAFVPGVAGEIFKELALTVTFALLASLVVSLTVVPMIASRLLRPVHRSAAENTGAEPQRPEPERRSPKAGDVVPRSSLVYAYRSLLAWALGQRAVVLVAAAVVLASSLLLVPKIGTEFLPTADEGQFQITVKMPPNAALSATDEKVRQIESVLADNNDVEKSSVTVGAGEGLDALLGGASDAGPAKAVILVNKNSDSKKSTDDLIADVRRSVDKVAAPAQVFYSAQSAVVQTAGGLDNGLQLNVSAPDQATLEKHLPEVINAVTGVDGITSVQSNLSSRTDELQVRVDRSKALRYGLTPGQVAMAVNLEVRGATISRLEQGDKSYDIFLALRPEDRSSEKTLNDLLVASPLGQMARLGDIASIQRGQGPASITRENRRVSAQLTGRIEGRDLGSVAQDVQRKIDDLNLPPGIKVSQAGLADLMTEGFSGLTLALLLAIVLVFMVMAAEFESFLHPFVILLSLPLAVTGVVLALWASGYHFGITAFMGGIMLVGIVVKNGIIMIDYVNQLRASGRDVYTAVLDGASVRLRPVLMTAIAAGLGLVPLALGLGGAGTKLQTPLAVAVVGGLASSTLLTLLVVPAVYTLFTPGFAAAARASRAGAASRTRRSRPSETAGPLTESAPPAAPVPSDGVQLTGDEALLLVNLLRKLTNTPGSTGASPSAGSQESEPA